MGIDPGASGAVAVIADDMRVIKCTETPADVYQFISESGAEFAVLERVSAMPRQGVSSTFKFGRSFGMLEGFLIAARIPYELVTPSKWQGTMRCRSGGDKNVTKYRAQQLHPELKITHAIADAILIAEYAKTLRKESTC